MIAEQTLTIQGKGSLEANGNDKTQAFFDGFYEYSYPISS